MNELPKLNYCQFLGHYSTTEIAIRNIDEYLYESFDIPHNQPFPVDHYEFKSYICCGDKKSDIIKLTTLEFALKAWNIWEREYIDFFIGENIYDLIDAIALSKKPVHYVVLKNQRITPVYFTFRREIQKQARIMGGNQGGLIICAILTEGFKTIDLRLLNDTMFTSFKTYDKSGCKYYNLDSTKIKEILKDQKNTFIIDINKEGCIIQFNINGPRYQKLPFEFKVIN